MFLNTPEFSQGNSCIHRLDPRVKWMSAVGFSVWTVLQDNLWLLVSSLFIAIILVILANLPYNSLIKRLLPINFFILLLWLLLPLTTPSVLWWHFWIFSFSIKGLYWCLHITLATNAIALALTVLLATNDIVTLGHALQHLRVPAKFTHLLLFTVRYISVLYQTYQQLTRAMQVRGFRAQANLHTYRSIGYLLGMLLVKSVMRARRITAAMKCRGYRGEFYILSHFSLNWQDIVFLCAFSSLLLGLSWLSHCF